MLAAQVRFVLEEEKEEYDQSDRQEPGEPISDGRLREGVYRLMMPLRVRTFQECQQNVAKTSHIFHIFNIPRFSASLPSAGKQCR